MNQTRNPWTQDLRFKIQICPAKILMWTVNSHLNYKEPSTTNNVRFHTQLWPTSDSQDYHLRQLSWLVMLLTLKVNLMAHDRTPFQFQLPRQIHHRFWMSEKEPQPTATLRLLHGKLSQELLATCLSIQMITLHGNELIPQPLPQMSRTSFRAQLTTSECTLKVSADKVPFHPRSSLPQLSKWMSFLLLTLP